MNKFKVLGESILFVVISILIQVMVTFFAGIYFTFRTRNLDVNITNQGDLILFMEKNSLIITLIGWIVTLIFFFIIIALSKQNLFRISKLNKPISLLNVAICVICGIGMNITINSILSVVNIAQIVPEYGKIITSIIDHEFYITFICVGLLVPIGEEILYRGIVLGKLRNGFSVFTAVVIQAFFFGLSHMNIVQGVYAFILGAIFGYVVIWTGSLYSSILLHVVINALSVILSHSKGLAIGYNQMIILTFIGILLTIIGLRILFINSNETEENVINFIQ